MEIPFIINNKCGYASDVNEIYKKDLIDKNKVDIVVRYLPMVKHKFIFKSPERQDVFIMGSFNDWSRNSLKMERVNKELFILEINLRPSLV